ncbi:MAG: adenylosuccinate synthetase [Polyangiales bacterium]
MTDALVRARGARAVVRFNGGAQAGHNVVLPDGRHHTFAQLSSGTFVEGVRTYLSRHVVVHPIALRTEAAHLARVSVPDALSRVSVSTEARVVTPFHQAACRIREIARGAARHGSCGVGIGEVMRDELEDPTGVVRMRHLRDARALRTLLERARERLRASVDLSAAPSEERAVFEAPVDGWLAALPDLELLDEDRFAARLSALDEVIFEGAQGVLLDEWRGFHPYTTWSTCTFDNALELTRGWDVTRMGVVRTYATRHGAGPFPTERQDLDLPEPHNTHGAWQGGFRRGDLDLVLLRYAVEACRGIDALAVTHLDANVSRICTEYDMHPDDASLCDGKRLRLGAFRDLDHQSALTEALFRAKPIVRATDSLLAVVSDALHAKVALTTSGPTHRNVRLLAAH